MLNVRLEGCGWSKDVGRLPHVRIEANLLTIPQQGEIARYAQGYWFADGTPFISVLIDSSCFVRFEDGEDCQHSDPLGPFRMVRSSGGSIWVAEPNERLLAKWDEFSRQWQQLATPNRQWANVNISMAQPQP